ncbi:unnamed protein product [Anisakis simplex]|uniref:CEP128 n=1 Tax=Anisakis simplex TaxID=6269 RepID=A0A0M3J5V4_ANISI|nr:unnamed protein product [Anisakis simplex]
MVLQEKDEILTVTSSPIADEHTDSGIENNRASSSYQHSPSTSSGFSPQIEWNSPREYDDAGSAAEKRKYFTQTKWHAEETTSADDVSLRTNLLSSSQHSDTALNNSRRSDHRVGSQVDTLLQIDKNQLQNFEDKANVKQEQV